MHMQCSTGVTCDNIHAGDTLQPGKGECLVMVCKFWFEIGQFFSRVKFLAHFCTIASDNEWKVPRIFVKKKIDYLYVSLFFSFGIASSISAVVFDM